MFAGDACGRRVIVVNTTFRAAPWADVLYAMDRKWWDTYGAEAARVFAGSRVAPLGGLRGVQRIRPRQAWRNSGAQAIAYAASQGARRILLLGYDCQHTQGRRHWHGDHPKGMGNAGVVDRWPHQFADLARALREVEIINCSRATALECFPRMSLEDALGALDHPAAVPAAAA